MNDVASTEQTLLIVNHPDVCDALTMTKTYEIFSNLFATLDSISSKCCIKHGVVIEDDVT